MSIAAVAWRVTYLWLRNGMRPIETLGHGFADPALSLEALSICIGKARFRRVQEKLNPVGLEALLRDKSVFYPYCLAVGLPVPQLHGVFDVLGGWSAQRQPLTTNDEWEEFLRESVPAEIVVKPARGVYGGDVQVITREGDGFRDAQGKKHSALELVVAMREHPNHRRWLIQDRLRNHPDLERLTASSYLQTTRIVSFVGADGVVRCFTPYLKVILGSAITDNLHGGQSGNSLVAARLDGVLASAMTFDRDGTGMSPLPYHPATGLSLEGVRLPGWDEALRLVQRAARLFLPIRAIGWDIALTPMGPVIVEGNIWWRPPTYLFYAAEQQGEGALGRLVEAMRSEAARPARPGLGYRVDRA